MSFTTFVLLVGSVETLTLDKKDMQIGTLIGLISSKSMFIWIFESLLQKGVFYFTGSASVSYLDILAYAGYKFLPLCLIMLTELFFGYLPSYGTMGLMWICFSFFFFMTMKRFSHANTLAQHMQEVSLNRKTFMMINCAV